MKQLVDTLAFELCQPLALPQFASTRWHLAGWLGAAGSVVRLFCTTHLKFGVCGVSHVRHVRLHSSCNCMAYMLKALVQHPMRCLLSLLCGGWFEGAA